VNFIQAPAQDPLVCSSTRQCWLQLWVSCTVVRRCCDCTSSSSPATNVQTRLDVCSVVSIESGGGGGGRCQTSMRVYAAAASSCDVTLSRGPAGKSSAHECSQWCVVYESPPRAPFSRSQSQPSTPAPRDPAAAPPPGRRRRPSSRQSVRKRRRCRGSTAGENQCRNDGVAAASSDGGPHWW